MSNERSLSELRREIDCEDDLQAYLERGMEQNGWTVLREVSARRGNYRADIVAKRDDIGPIGIECKYVTGGPVVAGEAARQIFQKYADEKFFQWDIEAWGVCLFGREYRPKSMKPDKDDFNKERYYHDQMAMARSQVATTKRILNGLGLGFVTAYEDRVLMEFLPSTPACRIPLFHVDGELRDHYAEKSSMNRISELVSERRPY